MPNYNRNQYQGRHGERSHGGGHRPQTPPLQESLMRFYDEEGKVRPELFDTNAAAIAEIFGKAPKKSNSYTQLRRFYDEVVDLEDRISENTANFDELLPIIRMLNAKAAYALGREQKVDKNFVTFIRVCIEQVNGPKELKVFKMLFEAVMGFYKPIRKQ